MGKCGNVGVAEQDITTRQQRPWDTSRQLPAILPFTNYIRIYCFFTQEITLQERRCLNTDVHCNCQCIKHHRPVYTLCKLCVSAVHPVYCTTCNCFNCHVSTPYFCSFICLKPQQTNIFNYHDKSIVHMSPCAGSMHPVHPVCCSTAAKRAIHKRNRHFAN